MQPIALRTSFLPTEKLEAASQFEDLIAKHLKPNECQRINRVLKYLAKNLEPDLLFEAQEPPLELRVRAATILIEETDLQSADDITALLLQFVGVNEEVALGEEGLTSKPEYLLATHLAEAREIQEQRPTDADSRLYWVHQNVLEFEEDSSGLKRAILAITAQSELVKGQTALDKDECAPKRITENEKLFGPALQIPQLIMEKAIDALDVQAEMCVLDLTAGLGGAARHMATCKQALVDGLIFSNTLYKEATAHIGSHATLSRGNILTTELDSNYDRALLLNTLSDSNEVMAYLKAAFEQLQNGGKLVLADLCEGNELSSHLHANALSKIGFVNVCFKDETDAFVKAISENLKGYENQPDFDSATADYWKQKLASLEKGEMAWIQVHATKPKVEPGYIKV